jgi:hypothetical protein
MTGTLTRPRLGRVRTAIVVVPPARRRSAARRARLAVGVFAAVVVAANVGLAVGMDTAFPQLRDPEFGRRLTRLTARIAEDPGRPMVVALGSSRVAIGLSPAAAHAARPDGPRVFNMGLYGAGPVTQAIALRRLLAAGVRPAGVLVEWWPAFARGGGGYDEHLRTDPHRLLPVDVEAVRDYFPDPAATEATMRHVRRVPWYEHRIRLMGQTLPGWLPWHARPDGPWDKLDPWGWQPGADDAPPPAERFARVNYAHLFYRKLFADYRVSPAAERALRDTLALCRDHGIPAALVWLPESSEFRGWAAGAADADLARLRADTGVPLIDARTWVPDPHLGDGFHLTRPGAAMFSARLAAELPAVIR